MSERVVAHPWPRDADTGFAGVWASIVGELHGFGRSRRRNVGPMFSPHLITRGRGTFQGPEGAARVGPGDVMCVWRGIEHDFYEDPDDPWHFYWMRLEGEAAEAILHRIGFSPDRRVGRPAKPERAVRAYRRLFEHYADRSARNPLVAASLLFELFAHLGRSDRDAEPLHPDQRLVAEARTLLEDLLSTGINVTGLAERLGVTRQHLTEAFRTHLRTPPAAYIQTRRIALAKHLLRSTQLKTGAVARACGYSYDKYFYRRFREFVGQTPTEWRQTHHRGEP